MDLIVKYAIWYPKEFNLEKGGVAFKFQGFECFIECCDTFETLTIVDADNEMVRTGKNEPRYQLKNTHLTPQNVQFAAYSKHTNKLVNLAEFSQKSPRLINKSKLTSFLLYIKFPHPMGQLIEKGIISKQTFWGNGITTFNHFLSIYRGVSFDVTIREAGAYREFNPTMLVTWKELPKELEFEQAVKKFNELSGELRFEALSDGYKKETIELTNLTSSQVTHEVVKYLTNGSFPEWLEQLTKAYEIANEFGYFNAAIIETTSVLESISKEKFTKLISLKLYEGTKDDFRKLARIIDVAFPKISTKHEIQSNMNTAKDLRNKVIHHGYQSTADEALFVINSAMAFLNELEKFEHS